MKPDYKQSLAFEEINECIGTYNFSIVVEEDSEVLGLLKNPFVVALKSTIKQGDNVLGIGRANLKLNPKNNKWIKNSVLYTWNASFIDALSKALKLLNELPLKAITQKENLDEEPDLENRDGKAYFTDSDNLKYASQKQKIFLGRLVDQKCNSSNKKEYQDKLESKYFSSYECSKLIKNLLTK